MKSYDNFEVFCLKPEDVLFENSKNKVFQLWNSQSLLSMKHIKIRWKHSLGRRTSPIALHEK